jgi:hypothetical protein|tara:strand:- start:112 stop:381 length:270 start_codon:yes stop_codon:yes gene_type:complete
MNWDDLNKHDGNADKIKFHISRLSSLVKEASTLPNIEIGDLEAVRDRMGDTLKQGEFWLEQSNLSRFLYDLQDLAKWVSKLIESAKNKS